MPDPVLAPVYRFRVRIKPGPRFRQEVPQIWRDIEIASNQTLYNLGQAIPLAFGFTERHLWSYFWNNQPWDQESEITMQKAGRMTVGKTDFPGDEGKGEFLFIFDYSDEWRFGVKLVGEHTEIDPDSNYPRVVEQHGEAPPQHPDAEEDVERVEDEDE
jgi:hypothetical protein